MNRNNKKGCTMDINKRFFKKINTTKSPGIRPREGKKHTHTQMTKTRNRKEIL